MIPAAFDKQSSIIPGRRISNEKVNKDGSVTTTTTTRNWDGSKTSKRKTSRSKSPMRSKSSGSTTNQRHSRARSASPARTRSNGSTASPAVPLLGSMADALEDMLGFGHFDNEAFEEKVKRCIPSEFVLLASQDCFTQAQEDWYAMDHYNLPVSRHAKKINAGSVATCALLQLMYENPKRLLASSCGGNPLNCLEVLQQIKKRVKSASNLEAKPTMSSSRPLGPPRLKAQEYAPFYIVPPGYTGKRRALLIGVKVGEGPELKGSHNDITNMQDFLRLNCGFKEADITVLKDDGIHIEPTRRNILAEFSKLCRISKPKDVVFIQFSGHGGRVRNSLYICPSDYKKGPIMDDVILCHLIKAMPKSVHTTMLVDCCYSGTVGDLPYVLKSAQNGARQQIDSYFDTYTRQEMEQKEREDNQKYQDFKQARAESRSLWRLGAMPAKLVYDAATTAAEATLMVGKAAADVGLATASATGNVASAAATGVYNAAGSAATAAGSVATVAGDTLRRSGTEVINAAGSVAEAAGDTLRRSGAGVYNAAGSVANAAGSVAGGALRGSGTSSGDGAGIGGMAIAAISGAASTVTNVANTATSTLSTAANTAASTAASPFRLAGTGTWDLRTSRSSDEEDFEAAARRESVERSRREAAEARAQKSGGLRGGKRTGPAGNTDDAVARSRPKKPIKRCVSLPKRTSEPASTGGTPAARSPRSAQLSFRDSGGGKKPLARGLSPIRRTRTTDNSQPTKRESGGGSNVAQSAFAAFSNAANSVTHAASSAANAAGSAANSAVTAAGSAANSAVTAAESAATSAKSGLRRTVTAPMRAKSPVRSRSPLRRTKTAEQRAEDAEEQARKAAVQRSRREAEEARAAARQR